MKCERTSFTSHLLRCFPWVLMVSPMGCAVPLNAKIWPRMEIMQKWRGDILLSSWVQFQVILGYKKKNLKTSHGDKEQRERKYHRTMMWTWCERFPCWRRWIYTVWPLLSMKRNHSFCRLHSCKQKTKVYEHSLYAEQVRIFPNLFSRQPGICFHTFPALQTQGP